MEIKPIQRIDQKFLKIDPDREKEREKGKKKKGRKSRSVAANFETLAKAVANAHEILVKNRSPYRFCVYRKDDDVMIDVVTINSEGEIVETYERNISHDAFMKWMHHIEEGTGLIFDGTV